jgi:hypothetical protein
MMDRSFIEFIKCLISEDLYLYFRISNLAALNEAATGVVVPELGQNMIRKYAGNMPV